MFYFVFQSTFSSMIAIEGALVAYSFILKAPEAL
jgi:hypothetical protein